MYVYSFIILVSCLFILGVLGPWEFSLAGRVIYIYSVCETPLCGVPGRYTFSGRYTGVDGGTVRVFSLFFCCSGYGTVEMVRGGVLSFFSAFFSLLSVLLVVGCSW